MMFSSALKSITSSNINGNYSISHDVVSTAGPWKIHDVKKKSTGQPYSVFVFDRKSLDSHGASLGRSSASSFKRTVDEVVDRLRKEASSLAKLRHPNILELVEPVEDIRGGGLQFVTEPVSASLAGLLQEKDESERSGGVGGRSSRYVTEDSNGVRRRRELELDELEIQKGLLQISKALEFLHENAGLVHGNLTPDAILVNGKSDWKISGLSFCSPPPNSNKPTSFQPISLSEILNPDPRLPRHVQINLDYTSPDFVLDSNLTASADMFSLGLLCIALYNSPHKSPLECNGSISSYKRMFSSSSTIPTINNSFLSSRPLPRELSSQVLPRLITRRPAQRMTAKEFQESEYFDNILVSTIRFLDGFPAKTPNEKASFLRGLLKVLPSFPKSVMEKKLLPGLLEELKDKDLISLILPNIFKIMELLPSARRAFGEKIRPSLREIFNSKQPQEKDPARDAGLMVVLENMSVISNNCSGKEFKDDILPIILVAIESPTHAVVDAALRSLPQIITVLDFSTIKNELFPVIATIFSRTSSLAIKVRGLQAFVILCGGSQDPSRDDGLDGLGPERKKKTSASILDRYTMQEKIIPLVKAIKTKEPAVMMAALNVLRVIGNEADPEFVAIEILPILWSMSLGPLLDLKQFKSFMDLIKNLSKRVEDEQTRKLQELSGTTESVKAGANDDFLSFGGISGTAFEEPTGGAEDSFEALVKGKAKSATSANPMDDDWGKASGSKPTSPGFSTPGTKTTASFTWSTPNPQNPTPLDSLNATKTAQSSFRTITPDLGRFETLTPTATQFSQPLQPTAASNRQAPAFSPAMQSTANASVNWGSASSTATHNPWASSSGSSMMPQQPLRPTLSSNTSVTTLGSGMTSLSISQQQQQQRSSMSPSALSSFSLPPPPGASAITSNPASSMGGFSIPATGGLSSTGLSTLGQMTSAGSWGNSSLSNSVGMGAAASMNNLMGSTKSQVGGVGIGMGMAAGMGRGMAQQQQPQQQQKSGLDKYESLL